MDSKSIALAAASQQHLRIFVHRASQCLTDHGSHGDGLICHALLLGLARRGHRIFAYTDHAMVAKPHSNLTIKAQPARLPVSALHSWEQSWRAQQWFKQIIGGSNLLPDIIWRMHPYGTGCPLSPVRFGSALIVGPLFYSWPVPSGYGVLSYRKLTPWLEPWAIRGWKRTLRDASLIFCATEKHAEQLRLEYPKSRIEVLPVPVDVPVGTKLDRLRASFDSINLIFVANLVANKNPLEFLKIVKALQIRGISVKGTIVGDGAERSPLQEASHRLAIENLIEFTGKLPNAQVYDLLIKSDLLVSTSIGEPYGRSIVEAMSVGTPAICHCSGGPAEFIHDGVDGMLVEQLDPDQFAKRITEVMTQGSWPRMSAAALQKSESWSNSAVIDRLEQLLYSVVRMTSPSPGNSTR